MRYLPTERGAIAYQRFGSGARTIVWTSPPLVSIESRWSRPGASRLWEFLASLGTVVIFDYRGFGSSERLPLERVGDLDELVHDLGAAVDQLASSPTVLVATSVATLPAVAYAARHPGRLDRLVLLNAIAHAPQRDADDPEEAVREIGQLWGTGELMARAAGLTVEPSQRWAMGHNERIAATPDVAVAFTRASLRHDVSPLLGRLRLPTLVIHTGDIAAVTAEHSQEVASAIPGAMFLLRPSSFFNWGEWDGDIHQFLTGARPSTLVTRDLAAVLFTDIVSSTRTAAERGDGAWRQTLDGLDEFVHGVVREQRGRVVKQTGDGHLMEFARPGDALEAACRLVDTVQFLGVELRAGVHFGEIERRPDGDIGGLAVHLAARVAAQADAGEILVTRTVAELTVGDGRTYGPRGTPPLKGIPGQWPLLLLERDEHADRSGSSSA